jgi:cytochrome c556
MAGLAASALFVGCADDVKAPGKSTSDSANKTPAAKNSDSSAVPAPSKGSDQSEKPSAVTSAGKPGPTMDSVPEPAPEPKATPKDNKLPPQPALKPDVTPEPKPEVTPAAKVDAKPPEGKVEVKAEPDPAPAAKPATTKEASPTASASEEIAAPKLTSVASAADLTAELKIFTTDLEKAVESEEIYKEQVEGRFTRDGNTIALIAIALSLHEEDSPVKPHAKAIAAAAKKLAQTKDFAGASQAVGELKAAVDGKGTGGDDLKWGKVATLSDLMKDQVPNIDKKLKDGLRHFNKRSAEVAANAATMALVAENAKLYLNDTKKPGEAQKWNEFASQMLTNSRQLAAKAHAGDESGAKAAMDQLEKSCHACHAVFNPEEK